MKEGCMYEIKPIYIKEKERYTSVGVYIKVERKGKIVERVFNDWGRLGDFLYFLRIGDGIYFTDEDYDKLRKILEEVEGGKNDKRRNQGSL